jgi:hypothetical protein
MDIYMDTDAYMVMDTDMDMSTDRDMGKDMDLDINRGMGICTETDVQINITKMHTDFSCGREHVHL